MVGHWSGAVTSANGLVVNGSKWDGQTSLAALQQSSRQLFGAVDSAFTRTWSSSTAFPVAVATDVARFSSGTLRVRFNMQGGASDQNAGIVFGLRPNGEYHYVRYNTKDGNVALWRFVKGARELIAGGEVHKQLTLNSWHELVVTIRDNQVRGMIAGDTTIAIAHSLDVAPVGRVGVWVKRDAITAFRDFDTSAAPSSQPPARSGFAFDQALPPMDGKQLSMKVVDVRVPPGASSAPHKHGCAVVVYVISGAMRMQVRGGVDSVYQRGQTFFERPSDIHQVSANASAVDSARFTATFVCDHTGPLTTPVP